MAIEKDVLDQLLSGRDPGELFSKDGLIDELKKALSKRRSGSCRRNLTITSRQKLPKARSIAATACRRRRC